MTGFLNDGLRDWIAVGGVALALLQTWLTLKPIVGAKSSGDGAPDVRPSQVEPDHRTPYERQRAAEDERLLREYGSLGVFSLLGSAVAVAIGVVTTYAVIRGHLTLSITAFDWVLTACMFAFVAGVYFGVYGVWNWSKGRSASKHLLVMTLVRVGVVGVTIATAGVLWWSIGQNSSLVVVRALSQFIVAGFLLLLASAAVFVGPKKVTL